MSFQPKGIVWLPDVIRAVGEHKYGRDIWSGSDIPSLRNEVWRARAAKDPLAEAATRERLKAAVTQWRAVTELMRREFVGTPPRHKDAVPVYLDVLNSDAPLPGRIWLDEKDASSMFQTGFVHTDGRALFHPGNHGWHWSPTAAPLSGQLYLTEAGIQRLLQAASNDPSKVTVPPERSEMECPPGISASAWQNYLDAEVLCPGFRQKRGGTSAAARRVAEEHHRIEETVLRDLQRVFAAWREIGLAQSAHLSGR